MTFREFVSALTPARRADLLAVALLTATSVGGVSLAFRAPEWCAALMLGTLGLALWRWHTALDLLLAASGLCAGPLLELVATSQGLWRYAYTTFNGLPLWVFTLWPLVPLVLVRLTHALLPPSPARVSAPSELLMGLGILATEIPMLALFGTNHAAETTLATGVLMAVALATVRSPRAVLMLLLSGVLGPLSEALPVMLGVWSYPSPFAFGLPMWLPTGYALFGFAVVRLALGLHGLLAPPIPALARE